MSRWMRSLSARGLSWQLERSLSGVADGCRGSRRELVGMKWGPRLIHPTATFYSWSPLSLKKIKASSTFLWLLAMASWSFSRPQDLPYNSLSLMRSDLWSQTHAWCSHSLPKRLCPPLCQDESCSLTLPFPPVTSPPLTLLLVTWNHSFFSPRQRTFGLFSSLSYFSLF